MNALTVLALIAIILLYAAVWHDRSYRERP